MLLSGFWFSGLGSVASASLAATTGKLIGFVGAGVLACLAVLAMAAMCWCEPTGDVSLVGLALGRRPSPEDRGREVLLDVRAMEVAAVFVLARDLLLYLRGGTGSYSEHGARRDWPEDADLFLAWRAPQKSASAAARQLNAWQARHERLRLLSVAACRTVLTDSAGDRLLLPALGPVGRGQGARPGRR